MNRLKNWIAAVLRLPRASREPMEKMRMVAGMIGATRADEISCDDAFELLDQYAELVRTGQDPASLLPLVHLHIQICVDCREELEALLAAIGP